MIFPPDMSIVSKWCWWVPVIGCDPSQFNWRPAGRTESHHPTFFPWSYHRCPRWTKTVYLLYKKKTFCLSSPHFIQGSVCPVADGLLYALVQAGSFSAILAYPLVKVAVNRTIVVSSIPQEMERPSSNKLRSHMIIGGDQQEAFLFNQV